MLKVLHLVAGNLGGGATRGAYWLHRGLLELNVDSTLLYSGRERYEDKSVTSLADSPWHALQLAAYPRIAALPLHFYRKRQRLLFSTGFDGIDFTRHAAYRAADIVHLHWINGAVRMSTLRKIPKPILWTIRDMWPMTGGCHYALDCERYVVGCGRCPQLGSSRDQDLSRLIVRHKLRCFPPQLRAVGISNWVTECAQRSQVFARVPIKTIANNVDTRKFVPSAKDAARQSLGLLPDKKIVLIGAHNVTNFYKGFDLFVESLAELRQDHIHFVFFGNLARSVLEPLGMSYTHLGYLKDEQSLSRAYSAADVFVAPSRMEAFGKTIVEAMACGTPAVCFDATGPRDIVEHQISGYKAVPFSAADLARGVMWVLNRPAGEYQELSKQARLRAESRFDSRVIARQYIAEYEQMLGRAM